MKLVICTVGRRVLSVNAPFKGIIDEVSLYNRALSQGEVESIFNAGRGGKIVDGDGDGLVDAWERLHFGNLNEAADGDPDGDGLTNLQEFRSGTNPTQADTGGTGMSDAYKDADGDGLTNLEEARLRKDPREPNVAVPLFSPLGGDYPAAQSVTVSCPTAGATIRYTLDGQEPTEASQQVTGPLAVSGTSTLKARAWKAGWISSDTEAETYRISASPANQSPTVTVSPPSGVSFLASDRPEILVEASDTDGTISKVQLFRGNLKIAESGSSPLRYTLNNVPAGTYTFVARAVDNAGAVGVSSQVVITINAAGPVVALHGAQPFFTASPGTLIASVLGVNPGALTSLTLNGVPLSARTGEFLVPAGLVEGENTFTLVATDNQSRTAQASTTVYLDSVAPVVSITAPANNSSFTTTRINVSGSFTETSLKRIAVNGVPAFTSGNTFEALNVPLGAGANTIIATAEDMAGNTGNFAITVNGGSSPVDPVQLEATPIGGFVSLQVTFRPYSVAPGTLQQVLYDFNGDNIVDQTAANLNPITHTYTSAGEYFPAVTVVTSAGSFSSSGGWNGDLSRIRVNVQAPPVQVGTAITVTDPIDLKWMPGGKLYVLSRSTATLLEYDVSQTPPAIIRSLTVPATATVPTGLDVDDAGNVYVALSGWNQVAKCKPTGSTFALDSTFGSNGLIGRPDHTAGAGNGEFNAPFDVAVTPDGEEIAVSDSGNHRVHRFANSGAFLGTFGTQGSGLDQFNGPKGLCYDSAGYCHIVDSGNGRIVVALSPGVVGASGTTGTAIGQFQGPLNVSVGSRGIYVADTGNSRVLYFAPLKGEHTAPTPFTPRGALSIEFTPALSQPGAVSPVADFKEEKLYIADTGNNRVLLVRLPLDNPESVWAGMRSSVAADDIDSAIGFFSATSADEYRKQFVAIGLTELKPLISGIPELTPVVIMSDTALYRFERVVQGFTITFPTYFVKENGVWKIESF